MHNYIGNRLRARQQAARREYIFLAIGWTTLALCCFSAFVLAVWTLAIDLM